MSVPGFLLTSGGLLVAWSADTEAEVLAEFRKERDTPLADFTPSGDRRGMVLVVRRFERDQKTGVKKICRHDPLYKWAS